MHLNDRYASFMLRLQRVQDDNRPIWLTCIQSTKTGELHWFPTLDAFVQFLMEEFGDSEETASLSKKEHGFSEDWHTDSISGE